MKRQQDTHWARLRFSTMFDVLLSPSSKQSLVLSFFFSLSLSLLFLPLPFSMLIYYLSIATYRQKDSLDVENNVYALPTSISRRSSSSYSSFSFGWHWLIDDDNCPFTAVAAEKIWSTLALHVNTTHESNQRWCYALRQKKMRDKERVIIRDPTLLIFETSRNHPIFIHLYSLIICR